MSVKALTWALGRVVGNPTRKLVLITLADAANELGECWPSQNWLSQVAEVSDRSIRTHLKALEDDGIIAREPRWLGTGGRTSDLFHLVGMAEEDSAPPGSELPASLRNEPPLEPTDPPPEDSSGIEDRFRVLWKIHRNGAKKTALAQYRKARARGADPDLIELGLRWYLIAYRVGESKNGETFKGAHLWRWIRDARWEEMPDGWRPVELASAGERSRFYE